MCFGNFRKPYIGKGVSGRWDAKDLIDGTDEVIRY
jgi:hypothetical protein